VSVTVTAAGSNETTTVAVIALGIDRVSPGSVAHDSTTPSTCTDSGSRPTALPRRGWTVTAPARRVRFTQAGTYHYICLIHPFMHGTIIVS